MIRHNKLCAIKRFVGFNKKKLVFCFNSYNSVCKCVECSDTDVYVYTSYYSSVNGVHVFIEFLYNVWNSEQGSR